MQYMKVLLEKLHNLKFPLYRLDTAGNVTKVGVEDIIRIEISQYMDSEQLAIELYEFNPTIKSRIEVDEDVSYPTRLLIDQDRQCYLDRYYLSEYHSENEMEELLQKRLQEAQTQYEESLKMVGGQDANNSN